MKATANLLLALGIGLWTAGFFFGPPAKLFWSLGAFAPLAAALGFFMHLFAMVLPNARAPRMSTRKAEMRKCTTCGRPAVTGSDYCRYHTDEQRYLGGGGR